MPKPERTEKPTPKRLRDARKKGMVARSPEIALWLLVLSASFIAPLALKMILPSIYQLIYLPEQLVSRDLTSATALSALEAGLAAAAKVIVATAGIGFLLAAGATIAQSGVVLVPKNLAPKFERLSVAKNAKRIFSPNSAIELGKSVLKLAIAGGVAWAVLRGQFDALASGTVSLSESVSMVAGGAMAMVRALALAGLELGLADFFRQRQSLHRQLRMTKQEVKDEMRESEGDPLVKGRVRRLQRQMSRMRMAAAMNSADVLVVNPTHYAVALRYDPEVSPAPVVVAKGSGHLAARLRELASENLVPVVRDPLLARTLHAACPVGTSIPPEIFLAVAKLLAYVFRLSGPARYYEATHRTNANDLPDDLLERANALA